MSKPIVFDSSVFVNLLRAGSYQERLATVDGLVRTSSVVLAELWRGVKTRAERRFLEALEKNYPIWTPTTANWIESGQILSQVNIDHGFSPAKLRDLHFDLLIILTARNHGATLITSNRSDFELIHSYRSFHLEIWS